MGRFDQPGDDSWRDRVTHFPVRTCERCGSTERDESGPHEYLITFLCERCVRELWAQEPARNTKAAKS